MTRNERRRILRDAKKKGKRTYFITDEQLDDISTKYAKRSTSQAFAYMVGIVVELMHEQFEWNEEECNWLVEKLLEKYHAITDLDALIKRTNELSGVRLELDEDERE